MNQEKLMKILLGPHESEKGVTIADKYRQIVFKVTRDATKKEVKQAVEQLFEVKIDAVRTVNVKGKTKRFRQISGMRKDWKKAYVTLKEGYDISFTGGE